MLQCPSPVWSARFDSTAYTSQTSALRTRTTRAPGCACVGAIHQPNRATRCRCLGSQLLLPLHSRRRSWLGPSQLVNLPIPFTTAHVECPAGRLPLNGKRSIRLSKDGFKQPLLGRSLASVVYLLAQLTTLRNVPISRPTMPIIRWLAL